MLTDHPTFFFQVKVSVGERDGCNWGRGDSVDPNLCQVAPQDQYDGYIWPTCIGRQHGLLNCGQANF